MLGRVATLLLLYGVCGAAAQQPSPLDPILRVETGSHVADLRRIGVNHDCTIMVTGAYDKTIRLWALPGHPRFRNEPELRQGAVRPTLLQILRPPIDSADPASNQGKVYAVAMSPDGKFIAAGGWFVSNGTGLWSMYVFDTASGHLVYHDNGVPHRINHLVISANGRYLAATLHGGEGLLVWDTRDWTRVHHDDDYQDASYGAAFDDSTGTLYTTSFDGYLRTYGPGYDFSRIARHRLKTGQYPYHVAVSSVSRLLAIGYGDSALVDIYRVPAMKKLESPSAAGIINSVSKVAWSSDGLKLYAGGTFRRANKHVIRAWDWSADGVWRDLAVAQDFITHLLPCGSGLAFGANDPAFGLLDAAGNIRVWMTHSVPDMVGKRHGQLTVSEDGARVRFGLGPHSSKAVVFDLRAERLTEAPVPPPDLHAADQHSIPVLDWEDVTWGTDVFPALGGKRLGRTDYLRNRADETARSFASAPDGVHFVIGSEWSLRFYDRADVSKPLWEKEIPADAWAVNITRNGKLVVVAHGDGTIRWYRTDDGVELLALFVHANDKRWIAWSGKRLFMSSIGGESLIGWHVNQPNSPLAKFYEAFRFREDFYKPEILRSVLDTLDLQKSIEIAASMGVISSPIASVATSLPPSLEIVAPSEPMTFKQPYVRLSYRVHTASELKVSNVIAQVDGVTVNSGSDPVQPGQPDGERSMLVPLPRRDVTVTLVPYSGYRVGVEDSVELKWEGGEAGDLRKPKLFGLVMGMSGYTRDPLKWGAKDARNLKSELEHQRQLADPVFREIADIRVLTDEKGPIDRTKILSEFTELKKQIGFDENPVSIIFYSGHGFVGRNGRFFLMPTEAPRGVDLEPVSVAQEDVFSALASLPGRKILLIDACYAGDGAYALKRNIAGFMNAIQNGPQLSLIAYASTDSGELSRECDEQKNGCFTAALLDSIRKGGAAGWLAPFHQTDTEELRRYLRDRTRELSKGRQKPVMIRSHPNVADFAIFGSP